MSVMASQVDVKMASQDNWLFGQQLAHADNTKRRIADSLSGKSAGDRWIPLTEGQ